MLNWRKATEYSKQIRNPQIQLLLTGHWTKNKRKGKKMDSSN
jgi:hypothetical protein